MAVVYIGLGSNMGNRNENLKKAVDCILERSDSSLVAASSIKETKAVDFEDQPDFLNQVIKVRTELHPLELLSLLKVIESDLGRIYRFPKGPREIDLDILLYDDMIIEEEILKVPHPEILNRSFILEHLIELNSELADPVSKKKYSEVLYYGGF